MYEIGSGRSMVVTLSTLLGGIGLFLVGMILMTDGLKTAAGSSLQRGLGRMTRGPGQALVAGASLTALVQSSSATTLATIGFVSAGVLTFPQALGIIVGANLGTTSTGWIVAGLGLKLSIGAIALPLVGLGALARLLGSGRSAQLGLALAGFGLIFVGIDVLQEGMLAVADRFDPASFPSPDRVVGTALLVGLGAAITVVMQSSSAAVATTLTALHAGTIDLSQAAYLVVGQNLGTTVTAALAAVGATVPAKRTALGHILFNLATGVVALAILPPLLPLLHWIAGRLQTDDLALVIAGFHTGFNLLGVLIFLPGMAVFSRLVVRMVPDRGPGLTRHLDRSMLAVPSAGIVAARRALWSVIGRLADATATRLGEGRSWPGRGETDATIDEGLRRIREFLGELHTEFEGSDERAAHVSLLHAADHIDRLVDVVREPADPSSDPTATRAVGRLVPRLREVIESAARGRPPDGEDLSGALADISVEIAEARRRQRVDVLERTARAVLSPEEADRRLQSMRWVDRLAYHVARAVHHLDLAARSGDAAEAGPSEDARMEGGM